MKLIYIKFNEQGIVESFSDKEIVHDFATKKLPSDFDYHESYYQSKIENGKIVGVELRHDLEAHKLELEQQRREEINTFET